MKYYLDSSFIVESVINPVNLSVKYSDPKNQYFTSRLSQVEVLRTITKMYPSLLSRASDALFQVKFVELTDRVIDDASRYPHEITLKSSDAIHMATAELLLDVDDELVTLDRQMALNAQKLGIKVASL